MIDAAATMAEAVLRACPAACVLATSREPLRAEGECALSRAFARRARGRDRGPGSVAKSGAMKLFMARTRGSRAALFARSPHIAAVGRDLPAARRHPARDRTGRGPAAAPRHRRACGTARRPLPAAHRRPPHGAAAPSDAARHARLELRVAAGHRARDPAAGCPYSSGGFTLESASAVVSGGGIAASDVIDCLVEPGREIARCGGRE